MLKELHLLIVRYIAVVTIIWNHGWRMKVILFLG